MLEVELICIYKTNFHQFVNSTFLKSFSEAVSITLHLLSHGFAPRVAYFTAEIPSLQLSYFLIQVILVCLCGKHNGCIYSSEQILIM